MIAEGARWGWFPGQAEPNPQPLDLAGVVGAEGWARLPDSVRRRFAPGRDVARYAGTMELGRSAGGLVFALASALLGGPLPLRRQADAPARVWVRRRGAAVVWDRLVHGAGAGVSLRSVKEAGPDGTVLERTPGRLGCGLGMVLDVFEDSGALVFESRRYVLCVGRQQLPLPSWLTPGRCRVEHRATGPSSFRFTLVMQHPLLGRTFWQTGLFTDATPDPEDRS